MIIYVIDALIWIKSMLSATPVANASRFETGLSWHEFRFQAVG